MEPATWVTGGLCIALVSGIAGRALGNRKGVKEGTCEERRGACRALLVEKIDHLTELVRNDGKEKGTG